MRAAARSGEYWLETVAVFGQVASKDAHGFRKPVHLLSGQEAESKRRLGRLSGPPCRFASCLDLSQR